MRGIKLPPRKTLRGRLALSSIFDAIESTEASKAWANNAIATSAMLPLLNADARKKFITDTLENLEVAAFLAVCDVQSVAKKIGARDTGDVEKIFQTLEKAGLFEKVGNG